LSESGERVLFPSLICPAVSNTDLGDFSIKSQDKILLDDQLFLVGESARLHALPLWGRDKAADQDSFRLMLVAAAKLGASGPIRIGAGLPLAWYGTQRKAVKAALMGYGAMVSLPDQPSRRIWIEDVVLAPQGVAAAVSIFFTPSTRDESWVVLDIGYRTTDFCWVDRPRDAMMSFEPSRAGTIEVGYHDVVHAVSTEMEKTYHLPFRESELGHPSTVTPHSLRHTYATEMLESDVHLKVVQEQLGHSSSQMTSDLYMHLTGRVQKTAADAMEAILQSLNLDVALDNDPSRPLAQGSAKIRKQAAVDTQTDPK
jgi:plasmid segregation protein ParM